MVFPDVRGLEDLDGDPSQWSDADLLAIIAADRWKREKASQERGNQPTGSTAAISKADRGVLTFLKRLWLEAKKGDIVVVPADGWSAPVLIGELLTEPGDVRRTEAKDGDYEGVYFGRLVNWRVAVPKTDLAAELVAVLHTRTAVFSVGETVKGEIYRLAYRNFIYKGQFVAEFHTSKQKFTPEDMACERSH